MGGHRHLSEKRPAPRRTGVIKDEASLQADQSTSAGALCPAYMAESVVASRKKEKNPNENVFLFFAPQKLPHRGHQNPWASNKKNNNLFQKIIQNVPQRNLPWSRVQRVSEKRTTL